MPLPSLSTCALTARMMTRAPAFSILFSARVTLTKRYWVTSDERRRDGPNRFAGMPQRQVCFAIDLACAARGHFIHVVRVNR